MLKVDFETYFQDRIWFGWWFRGWNDGDRDFWQIGGWVRDPSIRYHRGIYMMSDGRNDDDLHYWDWLTKYE